MMKNLKTQSAGGGIGFIIVVEIFMFALLFLGLLFNMKRLKWTAFAAAGIAALVVIGGTLWIGVSLYS